MLKPPSLFFFFSMVMLVFNCGDKAPSDPTQLAEGLSGTFVYKTLSSVDSNLLSLDVYYSTKISTLRPVVIYVHGGGWSIGDKSQQQANKTSLFRSLNYIYVSVNYRLSPFPYELNNPDRLKYPTHNQDLADAIRWVNDNIENYGGDKGKMALLGHSAGAHLVALAGTRGKFLEEVGLSLSILKGVASIDTEGYDVSAKIANQSELYINAFGTDATENIEASPIENIQDGVMYPKFFIAKRGTTERQAKSDAFINKLELAGADVSEVIGTGYSHEGINSAIGSDGEIIVTPPLIRFLEECFE